MGWTWVSVSVENNGHNCEKVMVQVNIKTCSFPKVCWYSYRRRLARCWLLRYGKAKENGVEINTSQVFYNSSVDKQHKHTEVGEGVAGQA